MKKWYSAGLASIDDGHGHAVYMASDVDAKLKEYDEDNLLLSQAASQLSARIATLDLVRETQATKLHSLERSLNRCVLNLANGSEKRDGLDANGLSKSDDLERDCVAPSGREG